MVVLEGGGRVKPDVVGGEEKFEAGVGDELADDALRAPLAVSAGRYPKQGLIASIINR